MGYIKMANKPAKGSQALPKQKARVTKKNKLATNTERLKRSKGMA